MSETEDDKQELLLSEITNKGARIWCNPKGWYWVDRSVPWILGNDKHVQGPFSSASAAGRDCAHKLDIQGMAPGSTISRHGFAPKEIRLA